MCLFHLIEVSLYLPTVYSVRNWCQCSESCTPSLRVKGNFTLPVSLSAHIRGIGVRSTGRAGTLVSPMRGFHGVFSLAYLTGAPSRSSPCQGGDLCSICPPLPSPMLGTLLVLLVPSKDCTFSESSVNGVTLDSIQPTFMFISSLHVLWDIKVILSQIPPFTFFFFFLNQGRASGHLLVAISIWSCHLCIEQKCATGKWYLLQIVS